MKWPVRQLSCHLCAGSIAWRESKEPKGIERLGTAIALWGGLVGVLLWVAVLVLHVSFGLGRALGFCGTMGVITTLEFFQHLLA